MHGELHEHAPDGTYGSFSLSTTFTAASNNHDNATADAGRGAVRVATVGNKAKIIWTNVIGGGYVLYWNGNNSLTEWDGTFNTDLQDMVLNGLALMNQNCSPLGLLGGDCDDNDATAYPGVCP